MPGKKTWKAISRALIHVMHKCYDTWAVPNLSEAAAFARLSTGELKPPLADGCCVLCKHSLSGPTLRVYDAGQAYEMLDPNGLEADLDHLLHLARSKPSALAHVLKTVKCATSDGHTLRRDLNDRVIFKLDIKEFVL